MRKISLTAGALLLAAAVPAAAANVAEASSNGSFATAQSLDGHFSLDADPEITLSTSVPHASVQGGSNYESEFDYYKFSVGTAGSIGYFDIDHALGDPNNAFAFDSYLRLFDGVGTSLAANDDAGNDPGSFHPWDSFITYTFTVPGTYFIRVGSCCEGASNGQYRLNVSLQNASLTAGVPEPATWAVMLLGFGTIGAGLRRSQSNKKVQKLRVKFAG